MIMNIYIYISMGVKGSRNKIVDIIIQDKEKEVTLHRKLVDIAYRWVLGVGKCGVAFKELVSAGVEIPDVIGFASSGHSVLIEVKASRQDFLSDKKKMFRMNPELGMGTRRYYCCPTDLIKIADLPYGWGLIYVNEKMKARCVHNPYSYMPKEGELMGLPKNIVAEHGIMYSALRRLHIRNRIDEIYNQL